MMPTWNWDTVNFWSQIAFAFTGLELVSAMSEEVRDPQANAAARCFRRGCIDRADVHRRHVCDSRADAGGKR